MSGELTVTFISECDKEKTVNVIKSTNYILS